MDMIFYLASIFVLSALYAIAITAWKPAYKLAHYMPWLAFSAGELLVILMVALMGSINATDLFLLNAAGAFPMVVRWAYLDITAADRTELRRAYSAETQMADRSRTSTD